MRRVSLSLRQDEGPGVARVTVIEFSSCVGTPPEGPAPVPKVTPRCLRPEASLRVMMFDVDTALETFSSLRSRVLSTLYRS